MIAQKFRLGLLAASACLLSVLSAPAADLKPQCRGLMIREFHGGELQPYMDSAVVHVLWKDLEPADQKFEGPGWDLIEKMRKVPNLKIRLRVMCGIHAPTFVKQMGGPGISDPEHGIDCSKTGGIAVWNEHSRKPDSIARFWLPEVLAQYEQLMTEVARRYENAPEICEVVAGGAMTTYAEPFYRAHDNKGSNERLWQAGLNFEKDKAAHTRVIQIHDQLFKKTRTSLAINAWDIIDDSPRHMHSDFKPVADFAHWARQLLGPRLVLQNNGTGADARPRGAKDANHFSFLAAIEGPKGFQTRTLQRLGNTEAGLYQTLENALSMGANFVELPSGFQKCNPARLKEFDAKLRATK